MKKVLCGLVIALMMTGSGNLYSATLIYLDNKDEFTDERTVSIFFMDDEANMSFGINCYQGTDYLSLIVNPKLYFNSDAISNLKIRFDDKPMYEKKLNTLKNSAAATQDLPFILEFLDNLKLSKKFIMKIESEVTSKYTEYSNVEESVSKFLKDSLEMGCREE